MRIEEDHTYFVGSCFWGFSIWVHNGGCEADAPNNSGQRPTWRTVIEENAAASKADKLTGRQKEAYQRAIDELAQGKFGQNDHALKGQEGVRARDIAGSGKGRGKDRILYKTNDDGTVTIIDIGDYH